MQAQDVLILLLIVGIGIYFGYRFLLSPKQPTRMEYDRVKRASISDVRKHSELEKLLESKGYQVVQGAVHLPVEILYEDKQIQSTYTADLLVKRQDQVFVVKKKRKAERTSLSGVSIRRELFPLALLYQTDGVLFVDQGTSKVKEITFDFSYMNTEPKRRNWRSRIIWLGIGICIGIALVHTTT